MKKLLILSALLSVISFPLHAQRETLAVSPVVASPSLLESVNRAGSNLALGRVMDSLDVQLLQSLNDTNKFTIVERQNLQPILQEQGIGGSGNVDPNSAATPYRLQGADLLLVVGIDDFENFSEKANFASISREVERRKVRIAAVARLYDTSTGALKESISAEVEEGETAQYFEEGTRSGDNTQALYRAVAVTLANTIASGLSDSLYPPRILAKTGEQITFNRGEGTGVEPGQTWLVFAVGEPMIDPDTGENLGQEEVLLGQAEVMRVGARTSQAMLKEDNGVQKGHIIRPE